MTSFVIVHGAWGGGWEWTPVARIMRAHGHEVLTPTLTGMGERAHLGRRERVGIATHVEDVVAVLELEDLREVVLCGASYGGVPVTGAADRAADRIALVVYVDALIPVTGQSALDLLPPAFGAVVRSGIAEHGPRWRVPMPPDLLATLLPAGSLPERERARYVSRLRDHPAATFTEPVELTHRVERLPRAFVRCTGGRLGDELGHDPVEPCAARARAAGWPYRELAAPHDPQVFDAAGIAVLLEELAREAGADTRGPGR